LRRCDQIGFQERGSVGHKEAVWRAEDQFYKTIGNFSYMYNNEAFASFYAFPLQKMRVNLLTAPGILVIWTVTYPSTKLAQRCFTLVIKWVVSFFRFIFFKNKTNKQTKIEKIKNFKFS
jgi:hypothetical protein